VFILDTDHVTLLEQGRGAACERVRSRLASLGDRDVAVTMRRTDYPSISCE
jgi:hypothetical protein